LPQAAFDWEKPLSLEPVLIAGAWRAAENPTGAFSAFDPKTKAQLPERYPISGSADVAAVFEAARAAAVALRSTPAESIAAFLEQYAARLEARSDALVEMAARETALPAEPRLRSVELPRTVSQLRQGAAAVRDRSWSRATIDSKANIRSHHAALGGPVLVFGPNNFPFAFNAVSGGDFAAAIAAGNPVIAKANPAHPGTTRILAECALEAAQSAGVPLSIVQLLYQVPNELGLSMVSNAALGATAFTGSRGAGLKLKEAADHAGKPIYLELSSVNPLFLLPGVIEERGSALASELFDSCALGAGQFCTRPGLSILIGDERGRAFMTELSGLFARATPGTLLGSNVVDGLSHNVAALVRDGARVLSGGHAADSSRFAFEPTLLEVSAAAFIANPEGLSRESFGTLHLAVLARDEVELCAVAERLEGNLTAGIYSAKSGQDDALYAKLAPLVREKVGRLLNDKMPTGVAVSPAMNHGGPYPSTGHPGFTAVGLPASALRFTALHCYDNVRPERLPLELRDKNPNGRMWRSIDGAWSQSDVGSEGRG
jgi:alpha-ketoglutaric semialdehyde dehydrogenase